LIESCQFAFHDQKKEEEDKEKEKEKVNLPQD
jgi:hypothetical protein